MYVTYDGLWAHAVCLSAYYDCWPRPDRPISDNSFIARRGLVTLSARQCASLHVHQFRFPNLSLLTSPHSSLLLCPSFSSQGLLYMTVLLNITVSGVLSMHRKHVFQIFQSPWLCHIVLWFSRVGGGVHPGNWPFDPLWNKLSQVFFETWLLSIWDSI